MRINIQEIEQAKIKEKKDLAFGFIFFILWVFGLLLVWWKK